MISPPSKYILRKPGPRSNYRSGQGEGAIMLAKTWLLGLSVLVTVAVVLLALHNPKVGELFHLHVRDRPKRRLLLAAIGFFVTFGVARSMAFAAYRNAGPFHYVYIRGTHIHHLVWGILLLLAVGFCWLSAVAPGARTSGRFT